MAKSQARSATSKAWIAAEKINGKWLKCKHRTRHDQQDDQKIVGILHGLHWILLKLQEDCGARMRREEIRRDKKSRAKLEMKAKCHDNGRRAGWTRSKTWSLASPRNKDRHSLLIGGRCKTSESQWRLVIENLCGLPTCKPTPVRCYKIDGEASLEEGFKDVR